MPSSLPRGLRTLLASSVPGKLVGRGERRGYRVDGVPYTGITKRLEQRVWSRGTLPLDARRSAFRRPAEGTGPDPTAVVAAASASTRSSRA